MKWEQWQLLGCWLLGMGLSDLVHIISSDPLNNPPWWLSSTPCEGKEKWVLEKLSNIQGCTPECQSRKPSTLSQHSHAVGSRVASLYRLYSPFCLECSLLLIPCCQNLFHLAGTSLNVNRCEAISCSLYPQGHVFVLPVAWRILLRVWLTVVRRSTCSYNAVLSGWFSGCCFGFSEEVSTLLLSGACFGNFKFRLHLSFISEQWSLFSFFLIFIGA